MSATNAPCQICKGSGVTGYEKPMGFPPTMVFVPQVCSCVNQRALSPAPSPGTDADFLEILAQENERLGSIVVADGIRQGRLSQRAEIAAMRRLRDTAPPPGVTYNVTDHEFTGGASDAYCSTCGRAYFIHCAATPKAPAPVAVTVPEGQLFNGKLVDAFIHQWEEIHDPGDGYRATLRLVLDAIEPAVRARLSALTHPAVDRAAVVAECAKAVEYLATVAARSAMNMRDMPCRDGRDEKDYRRLAEAHDRTKDALKSAISAIRALSTPAADSEET